MAGGLRILGIGAIGAAIGAAIYSSAPWNPAPQESRWHFRRDLGAICGESRVILSAGDTPENTEFVTVHLTSPVDQCAATTSANSVATSVRIRYRLGDRVVDSDWVTTTPGEVARQDVPEGSGLAMCARVKFNSPLGPISPTWYFTADGAYKPDLSCDW
jgi:hypothetical protein